MVSARKLSLIVISTLLIFMTIWHTEQVNSSVDEVEARIEEIEKSISEEKIDELINIWNHHNEILSCTFEHEYLNDITCLMYCLKFLYKQDADSIYSTLYEIKWNINNMSQMQKISWGNLF